MHALLITTPAIQISSEGVLSSGSFSAGVLVLAPCRTVIGLASGFWPIASQMIHNCTTIADGLLDENDPQSYQDSTQNNHNAKKPPSRNLKSY